jgi:hypothetical protein
MQNSNQLRRQVLQSYKTMLFTIRSVFRGDKEAIYQASQQARIAYLKNQHEANVENVQNLLLEASDAMEFLRTNIVQAKLNEQGNYEMKLHSISNDPAEQISISAPQSLSSSNNKSEGGCCGGNCHS